MMDSSAITEDFYPTKIVVLSELTIKEKERFYDLIIRNESKFRKDENGRFITNIRLLAPNVRKVEKDVRKKDMTNYSLVFQERLSKLKRNGFIKVEIVGVNAFDYTSYPRFASLIAFNNETVKPKPRPLSWVMKLVEDIYDYRFLNEKNEVEREEDSPSFDLILLIFPVFVVRRLGTNVGLKSLVDQTCWDLLYNTHVYRRDYLELEIFARFLQEFYDHDDLLFFLYVRSVISKVLHISFKSRWAKSEGPGRQPKSIWMSHREAAHVARIVFGSDNEGMLREFMLLITPQMVGKRTEATDSRRIDITEFMHLSVVGYHQSQARMQALNNTNAAQVGGGAGGFGSGLGINSSSGGASIASSVPGSPGGPLPVPVRFLMPLPGQSAPSMPVPIPESAALLEAAALSPPPPPPLPLPSFPAGDGHRQSHGNGQQHGDIEDDNYPDTPSTLYGSSAGPSSRRNSRGIAGEAQYGQNRYYDPDFEGNLTGEDNPNSYSYNNIGTPRSERARQLDAEERDLQEAYRNRVLNEQSAIENEFDAMIAKSLSIPRHQPAGLNMDNDMPEAAPFYGNSDEAEGMDTDDIDLADLAAAPFDVSSSSAQPAMSVREGGQGGAQRGSLGSETGRDQSALATDMGAGADTEQERLQQDARSVLSNEEKSQHSVRSRDSVHVDVDDVYGSNHSASRIPVLSDRGSSSPVAPTPADSLTPPIDAPGSGALDQSTAGVASVGEAGGAQGQAGGGEEGVEEGIGGEGMNPFEELQGQREGEFMTFLCDPLHSTGLPQEYVEQIQYDLADRLRQTVNIFLSDKEIADLDALDDQLLEVLQLDQLRFDMEGTRDELVAYFMGMEEGGEDGEGLRVEVGDGGAHQGYDEEGPGGGVGGAVVAVGAADQSMDASPQQ